MKFPGLLMVVGLLASPGCERVRTMAAGLGKSRPIVDVAPKELIVNLSADELGGFSRQKGTLTIVEYYANWNGESMQLVPILKGITEEYGGRVLVGKINIDTSAQFSTAQGVRNTPDVRLYSDGKLVDRFVGLPDDDEIRQRIEAQVKRLPPPSAPVPTPASVPPVKKRVAEPMKIDWMPPGMKRS